MTNFNDGSFVPPQQPPMAPQQPYAFPPVYPVQVPVQTSQSGLGITAMVLGVVGAVFLWVPGFGMLLGILALIFGAIGLSQSKKRGTSKGMSIAGLVLGIVTIVANILFWVAVASAVNDYSDTVNQINSSYSNSPTG